MCSLVIYGRSGITSERVSQREWALTTYRQINLGTSVADLPQLIAAYSGFVGLASAVYVQN